MKKNVSAAYRFVIGPLLCLSVMTSYFSYMMPSPLLTTISQDIRVDVATAGYLTTLTTLFMGLSLMSSTFLTERLGVRRTMMTGMGLTTAGNLISLTGSSFPLLLLGRALIGAGLGIGGTCFSLIAATWFPQKERPVFVTLYSLGNSLATSLAFSLSLPLTRIMDGSWQKAFAAVGCFAALLILLWLLLGREAPVSPDTATVQRVPHSRGALFLALRRKDVWILTLYNGFASIGINAVNTYLPSYLELAHGISAEVASNLSSLIAIAGIAGTALGGICSSASGRRRPSILTGTITAIVSMAGLFLFRQPLLLLASILLFGFAAKYRQPATQTSVTELPGATPEVASAGYSLMFGIGSVAGIFTPQLLSIATGLFGLEKAMLSFVIIMGISLGFALMIRETGKPAK